MINITKLEDGTIEFADTDKINAEMYRFVKNATNAGSENSEDVIELNWQNGGIRIAYNNLGTINGDPKPETIANAARAIIQNVFSSGGGNGDGVASGTSLITPEDLGNPEITFSGSSPFLSHWTKVGNQVTLDIKLLQDQATWNAGDAFYFAIELPVASNLSDSPDLIGMLTLVNQGDEVYNVINNLTIEPRIGANPTQAVINGTYPASGNTYIAYILHLIYTVN